MTCHSLDGSPGTGPTFKGLYGKMEELSDGSTVLVDEAYLEESIRSPGAKRVKGFPGGQMFRVELSQEDIDDFIALIRSLQ